jgi:poly-D-alanine transfer protein DltD
MFPWLPLPLPPLLFVVVCIFIFIPAAARASNFNKKHVQQANSSLKIASNVSRVPLSKRPQFDVQLPPLFKCCDA